MKNKRKIGFRAKNKLNNLFKDMTMYGLPIAVGFMLLGLVGVILVLGITVVAPAMFGVVGLASQSGGRGFGWSGLTKGQKYGIGGFLICLSPFILFSLLWLVLTTVELWIDAMVVCMFLFLGGYIYFSRFKTSSEKGIVGNIMGSKVILLVGIILLLVLLVSASYSYATDSHMFGNNSQDNDLGIGDGDLDIDEAVKVENQAHVIVGAFDTFFAVDTAGNPILPEPTTNAGEGAFGNSTEIEITDDLPIEQAYPIPYARVTIEGYKLVTDTNRNQTLTEPITLLAETNQKGIAVFYNMSVGSYGITFEKPGYQTQIYSLVVNETYCDETSERMEWTDAEWDLAMEEYVAPDFAYKMRPSVYKVTLYYQAIEDVDITELEHDEWFDVYAKTVHTLNLEDKFSAQADSTVIDSWVTGSALDEFKFKLWLALNDDSHTVVADNWTIDISASVSTGMSVGDIKTINRHKSWYGATGLPDLGGQMMFGLKNQMQSMLNSYSSGLQSILPILQNSMAGAISWTKEKYVGHEITSVLAIGDNAEEVRIYTDASPTSITDGQNATQTTSYGKSKLQYREWEYIVFTPNSNFTLGFQVTTLFEGVTGSALSDVTVEGKAHTITDVFLKISDETPPYEIISGYSGEYP